MIAILFAALVAPAPATDRIFSCSFGSKQAEIIGNGDRLTYRFGRPGKPEITLTGTPTGGVFYHRSLYVRGEDQTLRFVSGAFDYVVFNRWVAPFRQSDGSADREINASGLLIMRDGKIVRRLNCAKGGDLREWDVFKKLRQDEGNLFPDDVG